MHILPLQLVCVEDGGERPRLEIVSESVLEIGS